MVSDLFYLVFDDTVFCLLDDKPYCPLTSPLFKLAKFGLILVVLTQLSISFRIDNIHLFHSLLFVSHIFSTNPVPLHSFIIVCSSSGLQVCLLFIR